MKSENVSRWKNRKFLITITIILLFNASFIYFGYHFQWGWTGFNAFTGPDTQQYQPTKTLWDWMQLLIVPAVLAVAALLLNFAMSQNEREEIKQRAITEREIALDNQREALLQNYLDRMSELLLANNLRKRGAKPSEARYIARARTLTVLAGLDPVRKGNLIRFLYDSRLIDTNANTEESVIDLKGANLNGVDLARTNLMGANLRGIDLSGAILRFARLDKASLEGAILSEANLTGAILSEANLTGAQLGGAKLRAANLKRANLNNANLKRADLYSTDMTRADLRGVDLSQLNLKDVTLDEVIISIETNFAGADLSEEQKEMLKKVKSGSL